VVDESAKFTGWRLPLTTTSTPTNFDLFQTHELRFTHALGHIILP